jgi:hypothetical protein
MCSRIYIRTLVILALFLTSSLKYGLFACENQKDSPQNVSFISETVSFLASEGLIESGIEISNGGGFQLNIFKLNNSFGNTSCFSVKPKLSCSIIQGISATLNPADIPLYLFNRRILI